MTETSLQVEPSSSVVVDWTNYARSYDLLLDHNPAYKDLIKTFRSFLSNLEPNGAKCLDAGGGTGNFSKALLEFDPDVSLDFLEPDPGMRSHAGQKLSGGDIEFIPTRFEDLAPQDNRYDLIICTHALYTMQSPRAALEKLFRISKPGGRLFLIDLTKKLNISDWRFYLLKHLFMRNFPLKAIQILSRSSPIAKENNRVKRLQESGRYWTPSDDEFQAAVTDAGWEIESFRPAYRGYSRIAEAVKEWR